MDFDFELMNKEEIISRINYLFEGKNKIIYLIEHDKMAFIFDKLVKYIYGKIKDGLVITKEEAKCLLYILYFEASKILELDFSNLEMLKFILFDDVELRAEKRGFCFRNWETGKIEVGINQQELINLCDNKKELVDRDLTLLVVTHELGHAKQFQDSINEILSLFNFIISIEKILDIYTNYNKDNYEYKISEINANALGMNLFALFMVRHEFVSKGFYEKFCRSFQIEYEQRVKDSFERRIVINGSAQDVSLGVYLIKKVSELVKLHPMLLVRYPVLRLVYNENGNLLSIRELFKKRLELANDNNINELNKIYDFVFDTYFKCEDIEIKLAEIELYLDSILYEDKFAEKLLLKYSNLYKEDENMLKKQKSRLK